ncbi:unnamed protein product [Ixodes hexagonus]
MTREMKRRSPDLRKLGDSMKKTRSSRRKWIMETQPSTADVLKKYPALANAEMLHQEFIAITGVDLESKLLAFINKYGERCLYLVKSRRCAKETVHELEADLEKLEGDARKCCFAVGMLQLLPMLLKEQPRFLKGPDIYPALRFEGSKAHEAKDIFAVFEGLNVEVVDIIAGVTTVMEIYWIFNIKHSSQNKNTLALLEHFCGLPSAPQTPSVIRAISAIENVLKDVE